MPDELADAIIGEQLDEAGLPRRLAPSGSEANVRTITRLLLAGLQLGFGAVVAHAQAIRGVVIEGGTREPVVAAELVVLDTTSRVHGRALTDSTGAFRVRVPRAGRYVLRVTHMAFAAHTSSAVDVGPAETVTVELRLGGAVQLPPLVVTARSNARLAEFHQRRASNAFGRFITREEMDRRPSSTITDLLRGMPGVTVTTVQGRGRTTTLVAMRSPRGRCDPAIFIDGLAVRQYPQSTLDDILQPNMIAGVEVYTSSAGAPVQFANLTGCGSIVFWTRTGDEEEGRRMSWRRALLGVGAAVLILTMVR